MLIRSAELVSFRRVPMGRLVFALTEVEQRAQSRGLPQVADYAGLAVQQGRDVMKATMRRAAGSRGRYAPVATEYDRLVDNILVGTDRYLDAQERIYEGEPRGQASGRLRRELLPEGVAAISRLPYAQQHAQVTALLARANDPDLAADIEQLPELGALLTRLETSNQQYGDALYAGTDVPTSRDIESGRARCQDLLAETAAIIMSHYALSAPDDTEGRDHLLAPILNQVEASRRRRGTAEDIDPDTGEPAGDAPVEPDAPSVEPDEPGESSVELGIDSGIDPDIG